jgi:hypothetical protein
MSEIRPIRERELLVDDDVRTVLRRQLDPLITNALNSRGYTEEHSPIGRITLDSFAVIPSNTFLTQFKRARFAGLAVNTTHDIKDSEKQLVKSSLELSNIGGFSTSRFISLGDHFFTQTSQAAESEKKNLKNEVDKKSAADILQDIRAHTMLGYDSSDVMIQPSHTIEELEDLHASRNVDIRAHYQMLTSPEHGDIQMNIGESFELRDVKSRDRIQKKRVNTKKFFELIARQPLMNGTSTVGVSYRSSKNNSEVKLTAIIEDTSYSNEEKQIMYDEMVYKFQEQDVTKFGRGVMQNLKAIADSESNIIRLG